MILRHPGAVNGPVAVPIYKRVMMNKRLLTLLASAAVVAAGTSAALAQSYPSTPGAYIGQAGENRPGLPNFDSIDDEDAPAARNSGTLPPPGPVMSPDDPRYGRPMGASN